MRVTTWLDAVLTEVDCGLRAVFAKPVASRPSPAEGLVSTDLTATQRQRVGAFMRINHTGEVCAQALYRGQMTVAARPGTYSMLKQACVEEQDHLCWTAERIAELSEHRSYLNPLWYVASFAIGVVAASVSDAYSLGFVEETERQVASHLAGHLQCIPTGDKRSIAILEQMKADEEHHGQQAREQGAKPVPAWFCSFMWLKSQVMVRVCYYL